MMNRVNQLEERVKQLESELVRTKSVQKTSVIRMLGEGLLYLIFGVVVIRADYRCIIWNYYVAW